VELERVALFQRHDWVKFAFVVIVLLSLSLGREYGRYRELVAFDNPLVSAVVLQQSLRSNERGAYTRLTMQLDNGARFVTSAPPNLRELAGYRVTLQLYPDGLTFREYLHTFYAGSTLIRVAREPVLRARFMRAVHAQHDSPIMQEIYAALFAAGPLSSSTREALSRLGISHLLAISGFHLGVLSLLLYAFFRPPYQWAQARWFPYRSRSRDLFVVVAFALFGYVWFLDFVPSLVRAFAMMLVGFILYDRGIKIVSMQSFAVAVVVLLALMPRLFFALGFWLSVCGVFAILLFIRLAESWPRPAQLAGVYLWVYLLMLPLSLYLFGTFSLYHPLSVVWSVLFMVFYPLAMLLHLIGMGGLFDHWLLMGLAQGEAVNVVIPGMVAAAVLVVALAGLRYRKALWLLALLAFAVFIYAVNHVA